MTPEVNAIPDQSWTVAQLLSKYPQTAQAFYQLKTDCVGCILSRFCTLKSVAKAYDLELEQMMATIQQMVNPNQPKE